MPLSPADWHQRFTLQAQWTGDLRRHLYTRIGIESTNRILEIGCGTGALLTEFLSFGHAETHGLDIKPEFLELASRNAQEARLTCGDAHTLPYPENSFDLTVCHFLLLWLGQPLSVLNEMARVTRRGGVLAALAEPDYGGRIDHPPELIALGDLQATALRDQGADPEMGRKLRGLFKNVGAKGIESGVLGGQWMDSPTEEYLESEWAVLNSDLSGYLSAAEIEDLRQLDESAWARGERVLFVPTFYAWGRKP
ncbi:MAG TPA: class I SAM-dependent methyltransferase [Anaerolineales bacterium]|nr:class I SAM-dependent methyltransferase [Anaerolineales bacterium]